MKRWWIGVGLGVVLGSVALADERKRLESPEALQRAAEAVETAMKDLVTFQAEYTRTYLPKGRPIRLTEEGIFFWKQKANGKALARWEGVDEDGPKLTLIDDRDMTIWREDVDASPPKPAEGSDEGEEDREIVWKQVKTASFEDVRILHASRFRFPLLPDWRDAYTLSGPHTVSDYNTLQAPLYSNGVPAALGFLPPKGHNTAIKMVSYLFEDSGFPYRIRCDVFNWDLFWIDLGEWEINPNLSDDLFEPPQPPEVFEEEEAKKAGLPKENP